MNYKILLKLALSSLLFQSCRGPSVYEFIQPGKSYQLIIQKHDLMTNTFWYDENYIITPYDQMFKHYSGRAAHFNFEVNGDTAILYMADTVKIVPSDAFKLHKNRLQRELLMADKSANSRAIYRRSKQSDTVRYSLRKIYNPAAFGSFYSFFQKDSSEFLITDYFKESEYFYETIDIKQFKLIKDPVNVRVKDDNAQQISNKQVNNHVHCDSVRPLKLLNPQDLKGEKQKTVVLYTYISCPPCALLLNDLITLESIGKLNASQIKMLNTADDSTAIAFYKEKRKHPFEFIRQDFKCHSGSAPVYAGYDEQGNLIWTKTGYSKNSATEIADFLKED